MRFHKVHNVKLPRVLIVSVLLFSVFSSCGFNRYNGLKSCEPAIIHVNSLSARIQKAFPSKGIAKIVITGGNGRISGRMAWNATDKDHIRIALMGLAGYSSARLECDVDGCVFSYMEAAGIRKKRVDRDFLSSLCGIDIDIDEFITWISSGAFLPRFHSARWQPDNNGNGPVLDLFSWFNIQTASYRFDTRGVKIRNAVVYGWFGTLYMVEIPEYRRHGSLELPERIIFSSDKKVSIVVRIERLWNSPGIVDTNPDGLKE